MGLARMVELMAQRLQVTLPEGTMDKMHGIVYERMVKATLKQTSEGKKKINVDKTKKRKLVQIEKAQENQQGKSRDVYHGGRTLDINLKTTSMQELESKLRQALRAKQHAVTANPRSQHAKYLASQTDPSKYWKCSSCMIDFTKQAKSGAHAKAVLTHLQSCSK